MQDRRMAAAALAAAVSGIGLGAAALLASPRRKYDAQSLAPDVEYVLARAEAAAAAEGARCVCVEHVSAALASLPGGSNSANNNNGVTQQQLEDTMKQVMFGQQPPGGEGGETALERFTTDMTAAARRGKLDPLIGRDDETRRLVHILLRRTKNNPVLVGEPGVGKTAIVEGLAQRIVAGDVPPALLGATLLELDVPGLAAGCVMPGEFEERLKAVLSEVEAAPRRTLLFIDDITNLVPSAANQGASMMDGSAILKPALSRGTLRCIGVAATDKFKKTIEKDPALERRFQTVAVEAPSVDATVSILRGLRPRYEQFHGVSLSEGALLGAARLSARYITSRQLPDKAIDCLDEAAAQVKMETGGGSGNPEQLDSLDRRVKELEAEEAQLARRARGGGAGAAYDDDDKSAAAFMARTAARNSGGSAVDSVAASCLGAVRESLAELRAQRSVMGGEVAAERAAASALMKLRMRATQLRFEAEQAARDGDVEQAQALGGAADAAAGEADAAVEASAAAAAAGGGASASGVLRLGSAKDTVTEADIAAVISKWTGIPISKLVASERERLLGLEDALHSRIIGQSAAVAAVSAAIQRARADLADPNGPIASFMFLGPTGVGKTELAKALAALLFSSEDAMIRLDMSEYMEKHSVSRLIGAPPGYVGYDEGGLLTDAVRRRPYSVVLLDEVEKAHADVFNVLLQVLDDGRVTDAQGRTVSFKNALIIMTSNLGSAEIFEHLPTDSAPVLKARVMDAVRGHFRPEFVNRVDEFIVFEPLVEEQIRAIVGLRAQALVQRVEAQRMRLELRDGALATLARLGFDPVYGARPVKRALQRELQTRLAQALLRGEFGEGDTIIVDAAPDGGEGLVLLRGGEGGEAAAAPAAAATNGAAAAKPAVKPRAARPVVARVRRPPSAGANGSAAAPLPPADNGSSGSHPVELSAAGGGDSGSDGDGGDGVLRQ